MQVYCKGDGEDHGEIAGVGPGIEEAAGDVEEVVVGGINAPELEISVYRLNNPGNQKGKQQILVIIAGKNSEINIKCT